VQTPGKDNQHSNASSFALKKSGHQGVDDIPRGYNSALWQAFTTRNNGRIIDHDHKRHGKVTMMMNTSTVLSL